MTSQSVPPSGAPPRVLMILKRARGQGGLQIQARRVALKLRRSGVPVTLVTHVRPDAEYRPGWNRYLPTRDLLASNRWGFALALYYHLQRYQNAYDVVHVHGFGLETFAAMLARCRTGRPLVVKPSTAGPGTKLHCYALWMTRLPFLRWLWRGVDAWISISRHTTADLLKLGAPPDRVVEIPNGVDLRQFHPLSVEARQAERCTLAVAEDEVVLCTIARLTPHKRVDLLIRSFSRLLSTHPRMRLWIIGDGEQAAALRKLAAECDGADRISLLGALPACDVVRRLQAADLFVLVSLWEGLPNALLEALACGLPVVATEVSGMADVVRAQPVGALVPVDDEGALTTALADLVTDANRRAECGRAAVDLIRHQFSLDRTASRLTEVYGRCVAGKAPGGAEVRCR